jgi:hypothetical protein
MDLLNQLKALRDTTTSPEVKSICESHIHKIESGGVSNLNENEILESVKDAEAASQEPVNSPLDMIRSEQLDRSKAAAQRLMESWGGVGSLRSSTAGSYVDGKKEDKSASNVQDISESLKEVAKKDPAAKAFVDSQRVNNMGIYESILEIKGSGIYEHPNVKILCEKYYNLIKDRGIPEFLIAESFLSELSNFTWDDKVKKFYESIKNVVDSLRPEIEVSKAIHSIKNSSGSDFYSPVLESLNQWMISENKSVSLLSKEISRWSFNPAVRNLVNTLSLMESNEEKLSIPVSSGNSSVGRIFSPVHVGGGKTVFTIGSNIFEGSSEGLRRLNKTEYQNLPEDYKSLLESFYSKYVKVNEQGLNVYVGDKVFKIVEENEQVNLYNKSSKMNTSDKGNLAKQIALEISGSFGVNESKVVSDIIRLFENYNSIVELDFAKKIDSKVFEGASVNLIKWSGKIFLNRINTAMNENSVYEVNGTQATKMVKEFLKYDISEGLTEFLEGEARVKSIMLNDRKQIMENIAIIEAQISKLQDLMENNPLYSNSEEIERAHHLLETELKSLRKKWQTVNEEIEKIENGQAEQVEDISEEAQFTVGDYVKVKESGNTGKVISVDSTTGSYTVLMDNGRTGDFRLDEIVNIEDALKDAGEENQEAADSQEEEIKENESKETLDEAATPAATLKANTSEAPYDKKEQEETSKKDIENEKHANLEEAPEGTEKETKFEVKLKDSLVDKIGYNVNENDEVPNEGQEAMASAPVDADNEVSEADIENVDQNLAEAPGGRQHADYDVKVVKAEEKGKADIVKTDPEFASAPGDGTDKELHHEIKGEMGYNLDEAADIEKVDQNLAEAPGGRTEADYDVEVVKAEKKAAEIMKTNQELAEAPSAGTEAETDVEVNQEMGYNLDESEESKKN